MRFWLRTALVGQLYRWTTAATRATSISAYFAPWVAAHGPDTHPALTDSAGDLREAFTDYLSWLRSPAAATRGTPLADPQVAAAQDHVQAFYRFMLDHTDQAITATGDPRWGDLTEAHARLWITTRRRRRDRAPRLQDWIGAPDMARMVACLPILTTPTTEQVTITLPGGHTITCDGIGDPQAARAWLLQAMTGRRVSEIVHLIREQQDYARTRVEPGDTPKYLFIDLRHNHKGLRPRSYPSHAKALNRLDDIVDLRDTDHKPLRFTSTHRLRHTKATEMIDAGVPIHVVQRYFGHASPEMLMQYAATLASRAETEFLNAKRAGAFEKGNACLTCGHFATDTRHLHDLAEQRRATLELIEIRQGTFTQRHGTPMSDNHVWLQQRHRELASLDAITTALEHADNGTVTGAGTPARHPEQKNT